MAAQTPSSKHRPPRPSRITGKEERALTVGVLQFAPQDRTFSENVEFIVRHVRRLADAIVVLPEFFLGSYLNHPLFFLQEAELGRLLAPLLKISRERGISLVGSLPIDSDGHSFNRAILIHEGHVKSVYDKTHLFGDEQDRFSWGNSGSHVLTISGVTCSVRICMDIVDPMPLRTEESSEVQLILGPAAVSVDFLRTIHKARALENQAMSLFCNRIGIERSSMTQYLGRSAIFFPDGSEQDLAQDVEALETVRLRPTDLRSIRASKKSFMSSGTSS